MLYKLDLGIDHILLDEAQDTSPKQWEIVQTLVGEFAAGAGARGSKTRTLFAVGDDKQSIFSFQGAAPEKFGEMRGEFEAPSRQPSSNGETCQLLTSFRSGEIVLQAVDAVFGREIAFRGLSSDRTPTVHEHLPGALPGNVEIWPLEVADPKARYRGLGRPLRSLRAKPVPQVRLARNGSRGMSRSGVARAASRATC